MNIKDYIKYRDFVKKNDFYTRYKSTKDFLKLFSWIGTALLIFFGYYLLFDLLRPIFDVYIGDETYSYYICMSISFILIFSFELVKRSYIYTFSFNFIKNKMKMDDKEININMIIVGVLITISTILSVNGVGRFSNTSKEVEIITSNNLKTYQDSIVAIYQPKIVEVEKEKDLLSENNKTVILRMNETTNVWVKNKLKEEIEYNDKRLESLDNKIKSYKNERDELINKEKERVEDGNSKLQSENNVMGKYFKFTSVLFELFVFLGIYFGVYFSFRSFEDNEHIFDKNIQEFENKLALLNILYMNGNTKIGDSVMSMSELFDKAKMNDLSVNKTFSDEFYRDLDRLKIIKINNNVDKEFLMDFKDATKKVGELFSFTKK